MLWRVFVKLLPATRLPARHRIRRESANLGRNPGLFGCRPAYWAELDRVQIGIGQVEPKPNWPANQIS